MSDTSPAVLKELKGETVAESEAVSPSSVSFQHEPPQEKLPSTTVARTASTAGSILHNLVPGRSHEPDTWHPSWFRVRPAIGLAALAIAVLCLFASLAVLLVSRGEPTKGWYFQPTVYLAIATAISNTALNCALAQAAPISWWYKMSRGSTVRDLELEWEAGQSFPRAIVRGFREGRYLSLMTVASLAVALVVIDGPLLQRSSSVRPATLSTNVTLDFALTPEIPTGYSGLWLRYGGADISDSIEDISKDFVNNAPIVSNVRCNGSCTAKVRGPGVAKTDCVSKSWPIDWDILTDPSSTWGEGGGVWFGQPLIATAFLTNESAPPMTGPGQEKIILAVGLTQYTNWTGAYTQTNCTLSSAIREYNIQIDGRAISFVDPPSSAPIVAHANNTFLNTSSNLPYQYDTIAGLFDFLDPFISMAARFGKVPKGDPMWPQTKSLNAMSMKYLLFAGATGSNGSVSDPGNGSVIVTDPTNDIISQTNELFFRAGVQSGSWTNLTHALDPGISPHQSVPANQTQMLNVYHSDLRWFAGAAALQLLTILLVLPVFWGFWGLGVELTLSPFQIAKLLDAPLFRDVPSASGVTEIVRAMGDRRIKIGVVEVHSREADDLERTASARTTASRLGIADSYEVGTPSKGTRFAR